MNSHNEFTLIFLFNFLLSFLLTWVIGLLPPLLIRYVFLRKPLSSNSAYVISAIFLFLNLLLFISLGSTNKSHGVLVLIAFISYYILKKENKKQIKTENNDNFIILDDPIDSNQQGNINQQIKKSNKVLVTKLTNFFRKKIFSLICISILIFEFMFPPRIIKIRGFEYFVGFYPIYKIVHYKNYNTTIYIQLLSIEILTTIIIFFIVYYFFFKK